MPHSKLVRALAANMTETEDGVFLCQMNDPAMQNARGIALKTVIFCNNVYNIQTDVNDQFVVTINGGSIATTAIPAGYYSATQMATFMQTKIQALLDSQAPGATITVTFNTTTYKLESTVDTADMTYEDSLANTTIGLNNASSGTITAGDTYAFPSFPDLTGLKSATISVKSQDPKTFLNSSLFQGLWTNSIGVVPVDVPFGRMVIYKQFSLADSICDFRAPQDLQHLQISIRDQNGAGIPLQQPHLLVEMMIYSGDRMVV